jgi:uncharacterized protein YsxB (DUF464 family)
VILVSVKHYASGAIRGIAVRGHAHEDGVAKTVRGTQVCASLSGIIGVARMLLGGTPCEEEGGRYEVDYLSVAMETQERAGAIVGVLERLVTKGRDFIQLEHVASD